MSISLNQNDKNKIRENLFSFMEDAPIKDKSFANNWKPILPDLKLTMQFMPTKTIVGLLLFALLFSTGATAYASEDALPGDSLYSVKETSEKFRGWMKFTAESKAEWQSKMVERKLAELNQLVEDGKLTEEKKAELEEKIEERMERANEHFEKMKEHGKSGEALGIASRMENALRVREHLFVKAGEKFEKFAQVDEKWAEKFEEKAELMAQKREKLEEKVKDIDDEKMKEIAEGKMTATLNKIEEAEKFIENEKDKITKEQYDDAMEKLKEAKVAFETGKQKLDEEKYGEAVVEFVKAHRLAQHARLLAGGKIFPDKKPLKMKARGFMNKLKFTE